MPYRINARETIYEGKAFNVQRVEISLPNDRAATYDLVQHAGAVTLVPLDEEDNILFVRQFRIGAGRQLLELPAGVLEKGEAPDICAARELREETGMGAKCLKLLGEFFMAPGYSSEQMFVYLAGGLYANPLQADEDEFLELEKIPVKTVYEMAQQGQINDGKTLAALQLAFQSLNATK